VAEVISPGSGSERTDRLRKVGEYARLGIPQYWIVEHPPGLDFRLSGGSATATTGDRGHEVTAERSAPIAWCTAGG
jgi:Putative restriction endonuclease